MSIEQVYDERVSPLMTQIIAICKEHKIAMVAQFAIPIQDDPDLCCTTALTTKEFEPPDHLRRAVGFLERGGRPEPLHLRIEGGGKTMFETIL